MQKGILKTLALAVVSLLAASSLAGCANSAAGSSATPSAEASTEDSASAETPASESTASESGESGDYDFYIFNTKGENADALDAAVKAYQDETGVVIKTFSLGSGTSSEDALRADMNSNNKPAIFTVMNSQSLVEWVEGGFALDLSQATVPEFQQLVADMDSTLNLTMTDGTGNYGIPFNVEGYGYIVDTEMIDALFGADNTEAVITALKAATYDEFAAFVTALSGYIADGTAGAVTLAGQSFDLAAEKTGKAATLEGVFATAGAEKWTYGDHFVNVAIDAAFATSAEASQATADDLEKLRAPLLAYAKALDLKTSNAVTGRGPEFISSTTNGYDASVANFAGSKAVFIKQGNWCYTNIEKANADIVDTLTFIPVKMPFQQSDISVSGLTVEHMNTSIPVFVPNYYLLNAKVSEKELEEAQKFLVWLNTSETGQKYVVDDMAFIPYNADPATIQTDNSLSNSIISYMNTGNIITNAYAGAPTGWATDTFGLKIMEDYLTKAEWTEEDYAAIADYAITSWAEKLAG